MRDSSPLYESNDQSNSKRSRSTAAIVADGVYIPPAKRRAMQMEAAAAAASDPSLPADPPAAAALNDSMEVQKRTWEEQRRVVHGTINRLNSATIKPLIHDLFAKVNLIRLRGVVSKSLLAAAISSIQYSAVYAAVVAVLNTKLPELGELVVKRAVLAFRRHYQRKEKQPCTAICIFIGHLFHQSVVHELLLLQILTVLLDETTLTDDSVEVAIQLLTVTGSMLLERSPAGVRAVLERLRALLHQGDVLDKRVEYKLEQLLALRKTGFVSASSSAASVPIPPELDLVEVDDQITFDEISLDDETLQKESELDVFARDANYAENEAQWQKIRAEILGLDSDDEDDDNASTDDEDEEEDGAAVEESTAIVPASSSTSTAIQVIQDLSEADLVHLRRTIYLTIMSSATFEECAHKLAKIDIPPGREEELINMIIECCSQERTSQRYYGLIAGRFCFLDRNRWRDAFMEAFSRQYQTIHRLETNKLRNVAKLFAHLLHTDSLPWSVLSIIHLNEEETTSSSRIFIKIVVQEIAEAMGIAKLKQRFETEDVEMAEWFKGMFPKDNVRNTRYAINFFTTIGLGPLTDDMREYVKNAPKLILAQAQQTAAANAALAKKSDGADDDAASTSSSSSSESSSLSSSSDSRSYRRSRRRRSRGRRDRSRDDRRKRRARSLSSSSASSSSEDSRDRDRNHRERRRRSDDKTQTPEGRHRRNRHDDVSASASSDASRSPPSRRRSEGERRDSHSRSSRNRDQR